MAYNADFTADKYRDIAKAMGVKDTHVMNIKEARQAAIDAVKQLNKDVGIPSTLKQIGVKQEDIVELAKAAFDDVCTGGNPRNASVQEIAALYNTIY